MKKTMMSFVIPCYRSEKTIRQVIDEIDYVMSERKDYDYEIIAVNDCSPDGVYGVLKALADGNQRIKVVNLAKNFGKHSALMAGYAFVRGDYIVNLDDDFQSPICSLWKMMDVMVAGDYDVSIAEYDEKREQLWKKMGSAFNAYISGILLDKPEGVRFENFSILKRFVVEEMKSYQNPYPSIEGLIFRTTKNVVVVKMEGRERADDNKTGFSFLKSLALFANGFTNFSVKPLRFALVSGGFCAGIGICYGVVVVIRKVVGINVQAGWSSLAALILFSSGILMILLGVIGEYVGRIYMCINKAPQYVIRDTVNLDLNDKNC